MTPEQSMRVYAICQILREREMPSQNCQECPERVFTPYGMGTQGCFLIAQEIYDTATRPLPNVEIRR
jgi:hypothetical protein